MAANGNRKNNEDFSFGNVNAVARNGLTKIQTPISEFQNELVPKLNIFVVVDW